MALSRAIRAANSSGELLSGTSPPFLMLRDGKLVAASMLPLSLSYDHRVINGADAARFLRFIAEQLAEPGGL